MVFSSLHNLACDRAGPALVAVVPESLFDLLRRPPIEQRAGRFPSAPVHAHVERSFIHETDSPLGVVDLRAVQTKIEQDGVGLPIEVLAHVPKIVVNEMKLVVQAGSLRY